jgi:hypothetical protein
MCQLRVPRGDRGYEAGIQPSGQDGFDLVNGQRVLQHQLHVGLPAAEFTKGVYDQSVPGHRGGNADSKRTGLAESDPLPASFRLIDFVQDASRVAQEQFPGRAQADASGQSIEQEESHLLLEILDLPRQGRLSDMETLGGPSVVLLLSDRNEVTEVAELHTDILSVLI